jgi:hypothetical protein
MLNCLNLLIAVYKRCTTYLNLPLKGDSIFIWLRSAEKSRLRLTIF